MLQCRIQLHYKSMKIFQVQSIHSSESSVITKRSDIRINKRQSVKRCNPFQTANIKQLKVMARNGCEGLSTQK